MSSNLICRICACTESSFEMINIFEKCFAQQSIAEMIEELTELKIKEDDDEFPKHCCIQCQTAIGNAVFIRRKCVESETRLVAMVESNFSQNDDESDTEKATTSPIGYHCSECSLDFFTSETLREHYETVHVLFEDTDNEDAMIAPPEGTCFQPSPSAAPNNQKEQDPNHRCCGCLLNFCSKVELKEHSKAVHVPNAKPTNDDKQYRCDICYRVYTSAKGVHEHQLARRNLRYQCSICGLLYGKLNQLLFHESIHLEKTYTCDICEKSFGTTTAVDKHKKRVHNEIDSTASKHVCNKCGRSFNSSTYLKSHVMLHSDEAPFVCHVCGASFKARTYLRWHMIKHNSTFLCKACGISFKSVSELEAHQYRHSESRSFSCSVCDKSFYTNKDLQKHRRKVHKIFKRKVT